MESLFFAIVVVVGIVRALYSFIRWAFRSLKRLGTPIAPPQPLSPGQSAQLPRVEPLPLVPRRDAALPSPVISRKAADSVFKSREDQDSTVDPSPLTSAEGLTPLFGTTSDLVRALILQEALGSPLSKRKHPPFQ